MAGCCKVPDKNELLSAPHDESSSDEGAWRSMQWFRIGVALLVAGQAMVFSLAVNLTPPEGSVRFWIHLILAASALLVFFVAGTPLLTRSFSAAMKGRIVVEQLFLLGILGAFLGSLHSSINGVGAVYYEVVAILIAIYSFNILLSEQRRAKTIASARSLREQFARARVLSSSGSLTEKSVDKIQPGDRVRVSQGEGIPVDGMIREGVAFVQETGMTGEPYPVVKRPGDKVLAGTICVDSALTVEATCSGDVRELDSLLKIVEQARFKPSRIQSLADRMVSWFLPIVVSASVLTFVGWTLYEGWQIALFYAMAVLIVACPCAMGLATPIGIWSAISALARRGLVPNTGEFIERIASADTIVFDKTGTLSDEHLQVQEIVSSEAFARDEVLGLCRFIENHSAHPVARAIGMIHADIPAGIRLEHLSTIPGKGISARLEKDGVPMTIQIGNESILSDRENARVLESMALSKGERILPVYVEINGQSAAIIHLCEKPRLEVPMIIARLREAGVRTMIMSGDSEKNVRNLHLGIDEIRGGMTPESKARAVEELQAAGARVLFIGDGANDAAALSVAHASIALGNGMVMARESAQATLFGSDLRTVLDALCLSRLTIQRIRSNIQFAFIYNGVGITLAMCGLIHPVLAAVLMLLSSATVSWRAFKLGEMIQEGDLSRFNRFLGGGAREVEQTNIFNGLLDKLWREKVATSLAVFLALQGPLLAYLAQLDLRWSLLMSLFFLGIAIAGFFWVTRPSVTYTVRACFGMLALGNLAMIVGWWADAGFGAIIRDGVCLCGCEKSVMGKGLVANFNMMHLGMFLGGIPGMSYGNSLLPAADQHSMRRVVHLISCLVGMYLGMMMGATLMSFFPVGNAQLYMVCNFLSMTLGMLLGMILVCAAWFKFSRKGDTFPVI